MEPTADPVSAIVAVRALHTAGALLLFGTLVFARLVDDVQERAVEEARGTGRWLLGGGLVVALSGIAWLGLEAIVMSGGPWHEAWTASTLAAVLGSTVFGHASLARAALLVAIPASIRIVQLRHGAKRAAVQQ